MFEKLSENSARHSDGYQVNVRPGKWVIEHVEGNETITVGFEFLDDEPLIAVYPSIIERGRIATADAIDSEHVMSNVKSALDFLGWTYELR